MTDSVFLAVNVMVWVGLINLGALKLGVIQRVGVGSQMSWLSIR